MADNLESSDIDKLIEKFDDWRGLTLAHVRRLFREADPEVQEDVKCKIRSKPDGVAVWYHDGMLITGEVY